MRMILVGVAFVGALMASGSAMAGDNVDRQASLQPAQPIVAVANTDNKTPALKIVDTDFQFSQQERVLIAFWQLKNPTERRVR